MPSAQQALGVDAFVIVDEEPSTNVPLFALERREYSVATFVLTNTSAVRAHGFRNAIRTWWVDSDVSAWDRALFYFSVTSSYDFVWLIEDDVLIPSFEAFQRLHSRVELKHHDLVISSHLSYVESALWSHWYYMVMHLPTPWFKSMSCVAGLSHRMLCQIATYARRHGELAYHEMLFNSIAYHFKLLIYTPMELRTIKWRHEPSCAEIAERPLNWFHPYKWPWRHFVSKCHL